MKRILLDREGIAQRHMYNCRKPIEQRAAQSKKFLVLGNKDALHLQSIFLAGQIDERSDKGIVKTIGWPTLTAEKLTERDRLRVWRGRQMFSTCATVHQCYPERPPYFRVAPYMPVLRKSEGLMP